MDSKVWYESRTLWANLISGLASMLLIFGVDLGLTTDQQASIVTAILVIVNVIMRFVTKQPVSIKKPQQDYPHENL